MYDLFSLLLQVDIVPENWLNECTEDIDVISLKRSFSQHTNVIIALILWDIEYNFY